MRFVHVSQRKVAFFQYRPKETKKPLVCSAFFRVSFENTFE